MQFDNEAALLAHYSETGHAWLSLVAADGQPYALTCTEDGDIFTQTFPSETDNGNPGDGDAAFHGHPLDSGTKWLSDHPEHWYPVTLVAPLPPNEAALADERAALVTQLAQARRTLRYLAATGRLDDFAYDELSSDLNDGICDAITGEDVIAAEVTRLDEADLAEVGRRR